MSRVIIKRYTILRKRQHLPALRYDSILDHISRILLSKPSYKSKNNHFNTDSIHYLIHRNGLIDYQYEIKEFTNKDTASIFRALLLNNKFPYINVGYTRIGDKHLLLTTRSYLKFDHGVAKVHSTSISGFNKMKTSATDVFTDSATIYLRPIVNGEYYSIYTDKIPNKSSDLKVKPCSIGKIIRTRKTNYLILSSGGNETNKYLVITNKSREIVAVIK